MSRHETTVLVACAGVACRRLFADDVLTTCVCCGASVYHRPWALRDVGPGARAACLVCAARHEQAFGVRRSAFGEASDADPMAPAAGQTPHAKRRAPRTAGITRRALDEAARYLGERRR